MHKHLFANLFLGAAAALALASCGTRSSGEVRLTEALDDEAWNVSQWISASDAPVVTGPITGDNERAADGASWFTSILRNNDKVVSAVWMTSGLGVYELYVNGQKVGKEVLKPGFTHYAKTRRSFTYDITDMIKTGRGECNDFAVQVTPGWWGTRSSPRRGMTG
jgi:alpha-L-rhamnosidase